MYNAKLLENAVADNANGLLKIINWCGIKIIK